MEIINSKSYLFIITFVVLFGFIISITPNKSEAYWCEHNRGCNYNHYYNNTYSFNTFNGIYNTYTGFNNTYNGNFNTSNGNFNTYNGSFITYTGSFNTNNRGSGGRANAYSN